MLGGDREAVVLEAVGDPGGTAVVGFAVHDAGTEGTLLFAEGIGAVGTEGGAHGHFLRVGGNGGSCLLAQTTGDE